MRGARSLFRNFSQFASARGLGTVLARGGWVALVVVCALAYGGRRANAAAADHGKLSRETR